MNIVNKDILDYCVQHSKKVSSTLNELERETFLTQLSPQMISLPLTIRLLPFLVKMSGAKHILEVGTFTGYSAIAMAEALPEDGMIDTIEVNHELENIIHKYIQKAGLENKIKVHINDAKDQIPLLDKKYDLIYMDAGKKEYDLYLELILPKMLTGSWLIVDNVLWWGKVLLENKEEGTKALKAFNKKVAEDERLEVLVLPIGDGLSVIRKV